MNRLIAGRDVARLRDHLAECRPDDPPDALADADVLRHFRLVLVDGGEPHRPARVVALRKTGS